MFFQCGSKAGGQAFPDRPTRRLPWIPSSWGDGQLAMAMKTPVHDPNNLCRFLCTGSMTALPYSLACFKAKAKGQLNNLLLEKAQNDGMTNSESMVLAKTSGNGWIATGLCWPRNASKSSSVLVPSSKARSP